MAIEHDWRMRKLIRANLEAVGLAVREAVNVQHGLALMRQSRPALILLNLDMPGLDALHLLAGLDAQRPDPPIPVILMSAEPPERALLEHRLATSHLLQPFSVSALLRQVRGALDDAVVGRQLPL